MSNKDNLTEQQVTEYLQTFLTISPHLVEIDGQRYDPIKDILGDLYNGFAAASVSQGSQRSCHTSFDFLFSSTP